MLLPVIYLLILPGVPGKFAALVILIGLGLMEQLDVFKFLDHVQTRLILMSPSERAEIYSLIPRGQGASKARQVVISYLLPETRGDLSLSHRYKILDSLLESNTHLLRAIQDSYNQHPSVNLEEEFFSRKIQEKS